jgi:hypothetical protein
LNALIISIFIISLNLTSHQAIPQQTDTFTRPTPSQIQYIIDNYVDLKHIKIPDTNETADMSVYVLFVKLTGVNASYDKPDWELLAKKYGFKLIKDRSTQAVVEASPEIISSLQKDHPEIEVTIEKKYRKAAFI